MFGTTGRRSSSVSASSCSGVTANSLACASARATASGGDSVSWIVSESLVKPLRFKSRDKSSTTSGRCDDLTLTTYDLKNQLFSYQQRFLGVHRALCWWSERDGRTWYTHTVNNHISREGRCSHTYWCLKLCCSSGGTPSRFGKPALHLSPCCLGYHGNCFSTPRITKGIWSRDLRSRDLLKRTLRRPGSSLKDICVCGCVFAMRRQKKTGAGGSVAPCIGQGRYRKTEEVSPSLRGDWSVLERQECGTQIHSWEKYSTIERFLSSRIHASNK